MTCKLCIIDSERYVSNFVKDESIEEIINKTEKLRVKGENLEYANICLKLGNNFLDLK